MDIKRPDLKKTKTRRHVLYGGVIVATLIVGGVALSSLEPAAPRVMGEKLWLGSVSQGDFVRDVRGHGTLASRELRWIAAASDGRVERILVKPGAQVDADTILVELSNPGLVQQAQEAGWAADAAEAELLSLRAELERELLDARGDKASVEADYKGALLQVEAEKTLAERGIVSTLQFRQTQLRADQLSIRLQLESERIEQLDASIKAQLVAQKARVEQARRLHQRREEQVRELQVRAGVPGLLTQVKVEEGQQLVLGANVARVARPDDLIAELQISENQARDIQMGQRVNVDTRVGKMIAGVVTRIDPTVQGGTVQVDVELTGQLPPGARPDLSIEGTIEIERIENVLYIERPFGVQNGGDVSLFRLAPGMARGDDGYAYRVNVALGRSSVEYVEVLDNLSKGDWVVLGDTSAWAEYSRIRIE